MPHSEVMHRPWPAQPASCAVVALLVGFSVSAAAWAPPSQAAPPTRLLAVCSFGSDSIAAASPETRRHCLRRPAHDLNRRNAATRSDPGCNLQLVVGPSGAHGGSGAKYLSLVRDVATTSHPYFTFGAKVRPRYRGKVVICSFKGVIQRVAPDGSLHPAYKAFSSFEFSPQKAAKTFRLHGDAHYYYIVGARLVKRAIR